MADDAYDETTQRARGGFGASSLRDALRAVAGLREPTTQPTEPISDTREQPLADRLRASLDAAPSEHPQPARAEAPPAVTQHTHHDIPQRTEQRAPIAVAPEHAAPIELDRPADRPADNIPPAERSPQRVPPSGGQTVLLRPDEQSIMPQPVASHQAPSQPAPFQPASFQPASFQPASFQPAPFQPASLQAAAQQSAPPEPAPERRPLASAPEATPRPVAESVGEPVIDQHVASVAPTSAMVQNAAEAASIDSGTPSPANSIAPIAPNGRGHSGGAAMTDNIFDENKTRMVRGVQKPGRDDYYQEPVVAWLVVIGGPGLGAFRPVYEGNNAIGRSSSQRIAIDFGDEAISAEEQAYIRYDSSDRSFLFVPNLSKTNVVSLNESKPTSAVVLTPMDVITVGQTQLVFVPFCGPEFDWSELKNIGDGA